MTKKKSVNLLPEYLRTDKNAKFLSSTLDQFNQTPELERIDGYVGSKITPNFNPTSDFYLKSSLALRNNYSLEPALVFKDQESNISDAVSFDDFLNELKNQKAPTSNLDKLLRSKFYSYNPLIDWDKLINYTKYFWLPEGPEPILVSTTNLDVVNDILGQETYDLPFSYIDRNGDEVNYKLSNGMKISFANNTVQELYHGRTYIVEGVGNSIRLIDYDLLGGYESTNTFYNETFDSDGLDEYPFDSDRRLPLTPDYITINRSSQDLNPWSRYNRWFHEEVITTTAKINQTNPIYLLQSRARRPIVEFKPNLQLYNFGTKGISNVDYIDNVTVDALGIVNNSNGYYVDGLLLQQGDHVIFNADINDDVRGKVYRVSYSSGTSPVLTLTEEITPESLDSIGVNFGNEYSGTSWYYDESIKKWIFAQQHTTLNQPPLFDLFTSDGTSYRTSSETNNFSGNKIFGYDVGIGSPDEVLGFPLKYQNSIGVGSFLFKNFFMSDTIALISNNQSTNLSTSVTYLKINNADSSYELKNVWEEAEEYPIPIIEIQTVETFTPSLNLTSLDYPIDINASVTAFINEKNVPITFSSSVDKIEVEFSTPLEAGTTVMFKIITEQTPNDNGYYETPIGLTSNPMNGSVADMTLSELADHFTTMVNRIPGFDGTDLRDFSGYEKYGTRLIINYNPISFAEIFLGKKEHNVVDSLRRASYDYNQFKLNFLNRLLTVNDQISPSDAVDLILKDINSNKDYRDLYYRSDMSPYGQDNTVITYTVTRLLSTTYPIGIDFDLERLSFQSVLVYINDEQKVFGTDYLFDYVDGTVEIISTIDVGDVIKIKIYPNTLGSYIPPTPTKLGLYPKFTPALFEDRTFQTTDSVLCIIGHDGSSTVAFNDYRDAIILEFEKRIFNNIKAKYNSEIFDINSVIPGAFRQTNFELADINNILEEDFTRWVGLNNVDAYSNALFNPTDSFTFNYRNTVDQRNGNSLSGYWRAIYKYFYDTEDPKDKPWEMLGHSEKPIWWDTYYSWNLGPKRTALISAIINGFTEEPPSTAINTLYARPNFGIYIPVTVGGIRRSPLSLLTSQNSLTDRQESWRFGDFAPAESAWRRSSYWPFAVNVLAALTNPCAYCSSMYDTSRTKLNPLGQVTYTIDDLYLNPKKLLIDGEDNAQISGFGVYIAENGKSKDQNYLLKLRQDLEYSDFNLFHKLGGFASKEKLQVRIDSVDPLSTSPGVVLPPEDYDLILNVSNPVKTASISGIIVQKSAGYFVIKGYDVSKPYFEILAPIKTASSGAVTVGGVSESFTDWSGIENNGNTGLGAIELVTASTNTGRYYKQGQIVRYNGRFYRVKVSHNATSQFDPTLFQQLNSLPIKGGASAQLPARYEILTTKIPYGSKFLKIQEVVDVILGYGAWLEQQGFIFDEFNKDLYEVVDWKFTVKEFLFWTTQNWAENNLITLSPFASVLKYKFIDSVVADISSGYEYSLLKADGKSFPVGNFNLSREDGICVITTKNTEEGLFFATLNSVQKEHALVLNNSTIFNDTIYDLESGYKQRRIKLSGFRTKNWNGDYFSPGFVYDDVRVSNWESFKSYIPGEVVRYNGSYYQALAKIISSNAFDFSKWVKLSNKPIAKLLPNFDYKINQFEDFYSLDIDNFDDVQQQLAQHLIGYTPRSYLNNIFTNPISQYKFYQGFIKEKGTKNALDKLSKATSNSLDTAIQFNEEWAFRVGQYGGFETYQELEFPLEEGTSIENPYLVKMVDDVPANPESLINYVTSDKCLITPSDFKPEESFPTLESTWDDLNLELTTAGYVKIDDVTATAYNKNSLLDIANNSIIRDGDTFWVGFLENGGWNVYRYAKQVVKISGVFVNSPGTEITFVTNLHHNLTAGDIISVVNFNDQVNGVYIVKSIPKLNQFVVSSELTTIENEPLLSYGSFFKFENARFSNFEDLSLNDNIANLTEGSKVWVDAGAGGRWQVYEKTNNYTNAYIESNDYVLGQQLGYTVYAKDNADVVMTASPSWRTTGTNSWGRVKAFTRIENGFRKDFEYSINNNDISYVSGTTLTEFGFALRYDTAHKLYIASAPSASSVKYSGSTGTVIVSTGSESASAFSTQGVVKISSNNDKYDEEITNAVLVSPYPSSNERFGHSLYINQVTSSSSSTLLLVGAPGNSLSASTASGSVYAYLISNTGSNFNIVAHPSGIELTSTLTFVPGDLWGSSISGSNSGSVIAVGAPGHSVDNSNGVVVVYSYINNQFTQIPEILKAEYNDSSKFGETVEVSPSGNYIIVSDAEYKVPNRPYGRVMIYKKGDDNSYSLHQTLFNPVKYNDLKFGSAISINELDDTLVISSLGVNRSGYSDFDVTGDIVNTTFDNNTTRFIDAIPDAGEVYVYNKLGEYFVIADEISDGNVLPGSQFGISVASTNEKIYVGAPSMMVTDFPDNSKVFIYSKINQESGSWKLLSSQLDLVDVSKFKRIALIDSLKEEIVEYIDIIDPLKGKISGLADQEIKFKSASDPAIYSIGTEGTINDTSSNWLDDHVGELWWDLSTAKYVWYEQGKETYRKNNWGKLFPGATIDVYEWVRSDILPGDWAAQADTSEGLTRGISGQPKYPDNTVVSIKQIFNNVTNAFENVYYFWVKNKVTVPSITNRRRSSFEVASIIADPVGYGLKFLQILSKNSFAISNVQPMLTGNRISISIAFDTQENIIPKHTEWLLLNEGSANSVPNFLLEKKLIDSLLGRDSQGNLVPSSDLTDRTRYGLGIRPQQTLFKNRLEALRNLITFVNSVLIKNQITGNYSFNYLNFKEEIPVESDGEYDAVVEDANDLTTINAVNFKQAQLTCVVSNGKIKSVEILDQGYGYTVPPSVTVVSTATTTAKLLTTIDNEGRVNSVNIFDPGSEFLTSPEIIVRPHTAIVQVNSEYGNRWTMHQYDYLLNEWVKTRSQSYNTPLYWNYTDWKDTSFNQFKNLKYTISNLYDLSSLTDVNLSDYVKVKNNGQGKFIILERVINGNFTADYNIVYVEDGTLQLDDSLWDYDASRYSYDNATLEETLYDQMPDRELYYILLALKEEIFINNLKVNWNLFFFAAVKYAMTEQKLLDWAFKTSFININNVLGELDQRPVYRLDNESFYEQYINEVKPYHTKIRSYASNYTVFDEFTSELSASQITDFDLPAYFSSSTGKFTTVGLGDPLLAEKPWIDWAENYKFEVGSIIVADGGRGYSQNPIVTITTAPGDNGYGAEAEAYIRNGSVYKVVVTNPGKDYIKPPIVRIEGGGVTVTSVATISVEMSNNKIRKNLIGIKFDRISKESEITDVEVVDNFICSGDQNKFTLSWLANANKLQILPTLDGKLIFATDYTVEYFTVDSDYSRKLCRFVFLNYVPKQGQKLKIKYQKSIDLYNAIDRIDKFYNPTDNMVGKDYKLLMSGLEYPRTQLQGLEFKDTPPWGTTGYDEAPWGDLLSNFTEARIVLPVSTSTTTIFLNTTTGIIPGQSLLPIVKDATTSSYFRKDTVVESVNTSARSITITSPRYEIKKVRSTSTAVGSLIEVKTFENFNGNIRQGDTVVLSGIVTSGYNNEYLVTTCTNDTLNVVSKGILASTTGTVTTASSVRVYSVNERIFNTSTVLDKVVGISSGTTLTTLKSYARYADFVTATVASPTGFWNTFTVVSSSTGYLDVQISGLTSTIQTTLTATIYGYTGIEFWSNNTNYASLDTALSAGSWEDSSLIGALGVSPSDVIIDGDAFINPNSSHAPEEYVPGHTLDSVGINVYTTPEESYPTVISGGIPIKQGEFINWPLFIDDVSPVAIMVYFNGTLFDRVDIPNSFSDENQFYLDGKILRLPPQSANGTAFYTMIFTGSTSKMDAGYVAASNIDASTSSVAVISSSLFVEDVRSVYVSIDGVGMLPYTGSGIGYTLGPVSGNNNRAAVTVYLPNNSRTFNIEAWFFTAPYVKFNRFIDEILVENQGEEWTYRDLLLTQSDLEPYSSQVIVTVGSMSQRQRLRPPKVSYFKAQLGQITFDIDNKKDRPGVFNITNINVYLNGNSLRPGFDFLVNSTAETVTIINGLVEKNDVIAVEMLDNFDYILKGNRIYFKEPISNTILEILSFSDNADMNIRTERFDVNYAHTYTLSLPVINQNYVWVSVGNRMLVSGSEYNVQSDYRTILISDDIFADPSEEVLVTTINSPSVGSQIIGYRMFKDIFGRQSFKRLSRYHTDTLARPLSFNDDEIHVVNGNSLAHPNPEKNTPGVIIVDGERIEYFTKNGNVLSQLRRSTLGTGPSFYSQAGTKVIDQSIKQTIPTIDYSLEQHIPSSNTTTYVISTSTLTFSSGVTGQGIELLTETRDNLPLPRAVDQVEVYFGGRKLRKNPLVVHDSTISYDTSTASLTVLDPEFSINTSTQQLTLNIDEEIIPGTRITVIKRETETWTEKWTEKSLLTTNAPQARFLRARPAELPDSYYYGGELDLTDENSAPLVDDNGNSLQGF